MLPPLGVATTVTVKADATLLLQPVVLFLTVIVAL
jgi:hypothetical protein